MPDPSVAVVVFLSDAPARSTALARSLRRVDARFVVRSYQGDASTPPDARAVRAVVSDLSFSCPEKVGWIRARLAEPWARGRPYFCVMQQDTARKRLQANALGATQAFAPGTAPELERALLAALSAARRAASLGDARTFFAAMMTAGRSGETVTPAFVASCSSFIHSALADVGVREMLAMISRFDDATHRHCLLVAGLAAAFSLELGFRRDDIDRLTGAALLHDVGKSRIPLSILNKPGALDAEERRIMAAHPTLGFDMLRGAGHCDEVLAVVRSHHEALDGSGYPDGLSGARISDLVRLVTVCDVFAALIEPRPYRRPLSGADAYQILLSTQGKLDVDFVRAFRNVALEAAVEPSLSVA